MTSRSNELPEPVRSLLACGAKLPPELRARILATDDAVATLLDVVADAALHHADAPGEGYAPIHAVKLLGELGAAEAVGPLLALLEDSTPDEIIYSAAVHALAAIGPPTLEPALARLGALTSEKKRDGLREVLSQLGVRDERVLRALLEGLAHDVTLGAGNLAEYGDPAALPALLAAAERSEPGGDRPFDGLELIELEDAIVTLGGEIPPAVRRKLAIVRANRGRFSRSLDAALGRARGAPARVGRNDPCPCGSGKKYKKCCLGRP